MNKRRIAVVTGSRADYGLLYWIMQTLKEDPGLELQIIVTSMHLVPKFGLTYQVIEQDGFFIHEKIHMLLSSDTGVATAKSIGIGTIGFAEAFERLKPDIVVVLGDRFEMLSAAQAAFITKIPIAHIHGGEITEGAFDEMIRHSLTKMAHLHFTSTKEYRKRVIQMGEQPKRVFNVGAPGLECLHKTPLLSREVLEKEIKLSLDSPFFLVTYHPVTLAPQSSSEGMQTLQKALDHFPTAKIVFTYPNADPGYEVLIQQIQSFANSRKNRVLACPSLGQLKYWSAMKYADVVIGNSSSGLIEAPSLRRATVNIGDRQKGRIAARSVIDCPPQTRDIVSAIKKALSQEFQAGLSRVKNPYEGGNVSGKVVKILKQTNLNKIVIKRFYDIKF